MAFGGSMVKDCLTVQGTQVIPGPGISLQELSPCATTSEACTLEPVVPAVRSRHSEKPGTVSRGSPCSVTREKPSGQQRPSSAKGRQTDWDGADSFKKEEASMSLSGLA